MPDRYCVPTSLPWRIPCVGSWLSQNVFSSSSYETFFGSNTTSTTSEWPVRPLHTSRYVGFGVKPRRVADGGRVDTRQLPELRLGAPEAAETEQRLLVPGGKRRLEPGVR